MDSQGKFAMAALIFFAPLILIVAMAALIILHLWS
jgi:hypothetical protein